LLNEVLEIKPEFVYIIKLPKESGSCESYRITEKEIDRGFEIFKKLLMINKIKEELEW